MTNQNNEEVLELSHELFAMAQLGSDEGIEDAAKRIELKLLAFASTLREKDAKLIAMMVDALKIAQEVMADNKGGLRVVDEALSAAQPTVEAFVAEHDARMLEELAQSYESSQRIYGGTLDVSKELRRMAAEKRKSAKQEGDGK